MKMENIIDDDYNYVKENIPNNNNYYLNSENQEMEVMEIYPSEPSNYEMNNDQPFNQNYYKINEQENIKNNNNNFNYNNNDNAYNNDNNMIIKIEEKEDESQELESKSQLIPTLPNEDIYGKIIKKGSNNFNLSSSNESKQISKKNASNNLSSLPSTSCCGFLRPLLS